MNLASLNETRTDTVFVHARNSEATAALGGI